MSNPSDMYIYFKTATGIKVLVPIKESSPSAIMSSLVIINHAAIHFQLIMFNIVLPNDVLHSPDTLVFAI